MMQLKLSLSDPTAAIGARRFSPPGRRLVKIGRRVRLNLRKRQQCPVSQWVERHRVVPPDSPIPGFWRNCTTPYLSGIMDAVMFPSVQDVVVCAPPQTGKTDLALNIVGYTADRLPGNWLVVYPDEKTAADMSRDRIQPMFRESPRLRRYLTGADDDLAALRLTLKHVRIYLAWATSAARLASRPLPYLLLDEIDKYPAQVNRQEAGPIDLARKRTRTFGHMRKVIRVSTPTIEAGPIWRALTEECQVVFMYWVRCPFCDAWQEMEFTSIRWEGGRGADPRTVLADPKSTRYECTGCAGHWDDARRDQAVAAGEWREKTSGIALSTTLATRRPQAIGFHYRAWISRFVPLREAAAAFIRSESDLMKLRDFRNDYEAEPWRAYHAARSVDKILALVEARPRSVVPGGGEVAGLTAGVDTQDDGFWFWIQAWGYPAPGQRPTAWCVRAGFVLDFPSLAQVLWGDKYTDLAGTPYVVGLTLQDALGHRTQEVYDFARQHPYALYPSYGRAKMATPYSFSEISRTAYGRQPSRGALRAVNVNTRHFKNEASASLAVDVADPGSIRLYQDFQEDHARHLVAEFIDDSDVWQCPPGRANHLWDCLVLAFAAAEISGVRYHGKPEPAPLEPAQRRHPDALEHAAPGRWQPPRGRGGPRWQ